MYNDKESFNDLNFRNRSINNKNAMYVSVHMKRTISQQNFLELTLDFAFTMLSESSQHIWN